MGVYLAQYELDHLLCLYLLTIFTVQKHFRNPFSGNQSIYTFFWPASPHPADFLPKFSAPRIPGFRTTQFLKNLRSPLEIFKKIDDQDGDMAMMMMVIMMMMMVIMTKDSVVVIL